MFRVGLMIPSSNTTMEPEFQRILGSHTTIHSSRMRLQKVTVSDLELMEDETERAACELSDANVNVICYGCTTGSLFRGLGHDQMLARRIEKETGIPAIATAGAVVEALRSLHVKKITVTTPYTKEVDEAESRFLAANGFDVLKITGLGMSKNLDIGLLEPEVALDLARKNHLKDADGAFISCTNFRTIEIIEKLEKELGKPVVSSNVATAWKTLRVLKSKAKVKSCGRLLAT